MVHRRFDRRREQRIHRRAVCAASVTQSIGSYGQSDSFALVGRCPKFAAAAVTGRQTEQAVVSPYSSPGEIGR